MSAYHCLNGRSGGARPAVQGTIPPVRLASRLDLVIHKTGARRTKAALIYRRTKNLRVVQLLTGHIPPFVRALQFFR